MLETLDSLVSEQTEKLTDEFRESSSQIKDNIQNALAQIDRACESIEVDGTERALTHLEMAQYALQRARF